MNIKLKRPLTDTEQSILYFYKEIEPILNDETKQYSYCIDCEKIVVPDYTKCIKANHTIVKKTKLEIIKELIYKFILK